MNHRFLPTAALLVVAGVSVLASEPATFVLNNGERHSGTIVYGRGNNNIVDDRFHLSTPGGADQSFGVHDVAMIDFVGGTPGAAELAALPAENTGLMVMRNGSVQRGHLHNLLAGQVQWVNTAGERNNYPIGDVSRLYLNSSRARVALNAPDARREIVGTAGTVLEPGAVRVDANQPWTSTGVRVKKGDRVSFRTTGQVGFAQGQTAGADGNDGWRNPAYPVAALPVGGLIAKVGNSAPFPIGSNSQPIVMPADGMLMLGINDTEFDDNSGNFSVVVTKR